MEATKMKRVSLVWEQDGMESEEEYYLPQNVSASRLARKFLQIQGQLESAETKPNENVTFTLVDLEREQALDPNQDVSSYMADREHAKFKVLRWDVAGD